MTSLSPQEIMYRLVMYEMQSKYIKNNAKYFDDFNMKNTSNNIKNDPDNDRIIIDIVKGLQI